MARDRRVAIIGAGLAGLVAGRQLGDQGYAPKLFEKSRGLGGRLSWRRASAGSFDHGAQFVTAKTDAFAGYLARAEAVQAAARWPAAEAARGDGRAAFVGLPGMNGLVRPLAEGLDIETGVRVGAATRSDDGWRLGADDGASLGVFDALLVAIPAPQALALFDGHPVVDPLEAVTYAPCWAGLFAFANRLAGLDDMTRENDGPLAYVARDGSKPGRSGETIVVHAGPHWSRENLERSPDEVAQQLLGALLERAGAAEAPLHAAAHRWRYAQVERPLGQACLVEPDALLAFAGDYCLGPRAESAFESGRAAADALIAAASA